MKTRLEIGYQTKDGERLYRRFRHEDKKFYTISYSRKDAEKWMIENKDLVYFFGEENATPVIKHLINTNRFVNSVKKRAIIAHWHCSEAQTKVLKHIMLRYKKAEKDFYAKNFSNEKTRILIEFVFRKVLSVSFEGWKKKNFRFSETSQWRNEIVERDCCHSFLQQYHPEVLI